MSAAEAAAFASLQCAPHEAHQAFVLAEAALLLDPDCKAAQWSWLHAASSFGGKNAGIRKMVETSWDPRDTWQYCLTTLFFYVQAGGAVETLPQSARILEPKCWARAPLSVQQMAWATVAEAAHRAGRHDQAFDAWQAMNDAAYQQHGPVDWSHLEVNLAQAREICTPDLLRAAGLQEDGSPYEGPPGLQPVFIMGMPRSGTTLAESILATQPALAPAGEVPDKEQVVELIRHGASLADLREGWHRWRDARALPFAEGCAPLRPGALGIIDKMPESARVLPYLRLGFPRSMLIWMDRDPASVVWSCWRRKFDNVSWACRFSDIAEMHRLLTRWAATFGPVLHEAGQSLHFVSYEHLTTHPSAREHLVELACRSVGAEPDRVACHRPDLVTRAVRTASAPQAGRIYAARPSYEPYRDRIPDEVFALPRFVR